MTAGDDLAPAWRLIAGKELGDLVGRLGRGPLVRTLIVVAFVGLVVPLRFSGATNLPAFFAVFMAFVPARLFAIDAYAGERERGTLEALLASPYPDRAILVGKLAAATAYGTARGWLFLLVWAASAAALRVSGVAPGAAVPRVEVAVAVAVAAFGVAYAAAVYGLWQSTTAPSVRAIVESGGLLRLVLVVGTFFVVPYLLGLLGSDGRVPQIGIPGVQGGASLQVLIDVLAARPAVALGVAAGLALQVAAVLALLTRATLRRARREVLATVGTGPEPSAGPRWRRALRRLLTRRPRPVPPATAAR